MSHPTLQAVFLDRDGTLGGGDEMILPGKFECYPSALESIASLRAAGKRIYSFTNQPVIARGQACMEQFEQELQAFGFEGAYVCPHEHGEGCACRKPSTGMLLLAAEENGLDLHRCAVVGDRWTDMIAAKEAGCLGILVRTGAGQAELDRYERGGFSERWQEAYPLYVAEDLNEAVRWLLEKDREERGATLTDPDWPAWATEVIEIKPADPIWLEKGTQEAEHVKKLLSVHRISEVEHIGSTSIPGLPAKPILDLMARIPSYDELDDVIAALAAQDWHYIPPELDGVPSRRFFVKVKNDKRQCHLHLMLPNEEKWDKQLCFRNILRERPDLIQEYAELKSKLAEHYKDDREAYTHAKTDFVQRVLNR
ncbi:HAD-IIIA family hydrolase [Saccharibacillus endophyticus]|uniref:D,D-heptose 1,7-bisphosphate phosphatase n=1 Tax=Saccharibacillus endophyticus TaxID=2060666 RepID=A0ABQ1ZJ20_9BACL|nr:hypothetical protein GCM10007362_02690 [Saccharibacillus endophyticus]